MPEWFAGTLQAQEDVAPGALALRLLGALLLGWAVAAIYRVTHRSEPIIPTFPPTLILLTLLIATVTQVIGDNVARAFSLVGALSIVRFRTVVQDTRDTAFVIFAVVEGMAIGAAHFWVSLIALAIVGFAAIVGEPRRIGSSSECPFYTLDLRVPAGMSPDALIQAVREPFLQQVEVISVATVLKGLSVEASYAVRLRPGVDPIGLVEVLNRMEGVQSVSLERDRNGN